MIKRFSLPLLFVILGLSSCNYSGKVLPSVTGTRFEILVVMDDSLWTAPAGRAVVALLDQNMPALPQAEPVMDIIQCSRSEFGDLLKPTRNILFTEVSASRYTSPKITYGKNTWAQPQSVVKVTAPDEASLHDIIAEKGSNILDYFLNTERDRQIMLSKEYVNQKAKTAIEQQFGIQVDIPSELSKAVQGKNFYWATNDNPRIRKDLIIYSYPYTDKNTFTKEFLIAKRDSFMKANIPGEFKGSYMGTEVKHYEPILTPLNINNTYCAELKGLWRMYNGGSMGGPFYSQTRVDEINHRVITVEGFVFAPGVKKRNHIRQLEAVVYTTKLPQEINSIKEVSVVAEKKQ